MIPFERNWLNRLQAWQRVFRGPKQRVLASVTKGGLIFLAYAALAQNAPEPVSESQADATLRQVRTNALSYTSKLPNFICTEVIHRATAKGTGKWEAKDTLTVQLTYFGRKEQYQLTLVNGRKARGNYRSAGGSLSEGEFGTMLLEIFAPDTETEFHWEQWAYLRDRLTQVYSYRTPREHSHYKLAIGTGTRVDHFTMTGRKGFVFVDNEMETVVRITGEATEIAQGFPVKGQSNQLDYDYREIGGKRFLLPVEAQQIVETSERSFRNQVEFLDYKQFVGEAKLSFNPPR